MNRNLGLTFFVVGTFMLLASFVFPMVTVIVDTTPPVIGSTVPAPTLGGISSVYSYLSTISAVVTDAESGVKTVSCSIDGGATWSLVYVMSSGRYEYNLLTPLTTAGTHSFNFIATNNAGLQSSVSGTFTIYTGLTGTWYVNDIAITSTSQTIYAKSLAVTFRFVKTTGVADSLITCTVTEGTSTLVTLSNSATATWTGSYTFTAGTHNLELKAYDGTQTVTMSVIGMQIGPTTPQLPQLNTLQILGLASTGIGLLLIFTGRRKSGGG